MTLTVDCGNLLHAISMWPNGVLKDMWCTLVSILLAISHTMSYKLAKSPSQHTELSHVLLRQGPYRTPTQINDAKSKDIVYDVTERSHHVSHRSFDSSLQPWSCGCEYFLRDLGNSFYPRYIKDGRCRSRTCWYGHYSCVPFVYQFSVLKRLNPVDDISPTHPHSIGEDYAFVPVNVTVNCECRPDGMLH